MNSKKWLVGILVLALLIANTPTADALWGKKGGDKMPDRNKMTEKIAGKLGLTKEQKATFKARGEETQKFVKAKREAIKALAEKLKTELAKERPDRSTVNGLIRQMGNLQSDIQIRHAESLIDLKRELTPEQRKKFEEMLKNRNKKSGKKTPPKK